jgi:hypothetical protein
MLPRATSKPLLHAFCKIADKELSHAPNSDDIIDIIVAAGALSNHTARAHGADLTGLEERAGGLSL